ncbi:MAG TPA: single-stranded-DNA-specific exonuclease RecJ [Stellaceae bacterium]|nr:single-stranded-DNA-specific exonuclease RecJ [Stellaceae bacterium]
MSPLAADAGTFLGVERSLTNRGGRERRADPTIMRTLQTREGLSPPAAKALAARLTAAEDAEGFLRPRLKDQFPDPSSFAAMDEAATTILDAIAANKTIVIFADYDVDGATSAAQIVRWLRAVGCEADIHIPDRVADGYGPTPAAFRRLRNAGADLIICLDCGTSALDAMAAADELGLEVVVIDHHLMREAPVGRAVIVNPNRPDCGSGQGVLSAAGVTFVLLAALGREGRRRGLFEDRPEPDIRQWLDLAALGAVCDVTQLTGFNRAIVSLGLKAMSNWANPGLAALMTAAKAPLRPATVFDAGFVLGPRINAGGRIGRSDLGARLLSTDDPTEARVLAEELDALNASRRQVEKEIVEAAICTIEHGANFDPQAAALVVSGDDWHPGVIGIVAGRLRERYRKPTVVIGIDRAADIGRGSGRSSPGVNLGRAVQDAYETGLLLAGGGHAMAAGLTIRPSAIPDFRAFLVERLALQQASAAIADMVEIDALVSTAGATRDLSDELAQLAPFGPGAPEPLVALAGVRSEMASVLNGGHLRCRLSDGEGRGLKAIAWRASDSPLGRQLLAGGPLHIVGRLKADDWNGRRSVQLEVEDGADPRRAAGA